MAIMKLGERSIEIAPYKLGALRKAAPHIDAINASAASIDTIEGTVENAGHMLAIVAIGAQKIDPTLTAEAMEDMIGAADLMALASTMREILSESGLAPKGEPTAPSAPATEGASPASSATSSAS